MQDVPKAFIWAAVALAIAAVVYIRTADHGPMDTAKALALLQEDLRAMSAHNSDRARVDVITPDGEIAHAPVRILTSIDVIECPKSGGQGGTTPGRFGATNRTYAITSYTCLFAAQGPEGMTLRLSTYVVRSDDPQVADLRGGFHSSLQPGLQTQRLMRELNVKAGPVTPQRRRALWDALARHDIYVPADTTQTSPIEKAISDHLQRITN